MSPVTEQIRMFRLETITLHVTGKIPCHQDSVESKSTLNHHPDNNHQKYKYHYLTNFTTLIFATHKY